MFEVFMEGSDYCSITKDNCLYIFDDCISCNLFQDFMKEKDVHGKRRLDESKNLLNASEKTG